MENTRVVIVGAGLAGLRTAERLRRSGYDGELVMLGAELHLPYDRPPMSKSLLAGEEDPALPTLRPADRFDELDLDLRLGVRATRLDTTARTVVVGDGETLAWDQLIIATGLAARTVPGWAGVGGVHTLRTFDDCLRLRAAAARGRHATVVGAGVLGSEIAAALRTRGLEVDLVDPLPQPLCRVVGEEVGAFVAALHRRRGVDLHLGVGVAELESDREGHVRGVTLTDGTSRATDLVVTAIGARADLAWLGGSGLALTDAPAQGVLVDEYGAASTPGVWAAGDIAAVADLRGGEQVRIEHWTSAVDRSATVAANVVAILTGAEPRTHTELPYMWSDQYDVKVQCLGLHRPGDDVVVLAGSLSEQAFLAAHVEGGRVRAVTGAGMPAAVMRSRKAVAGAVPLEELRAAAPWERRPTSA